MPIPLSTSRIYLFEIDYQCHDDNVVRELYLLAKSRFPELNFKNIELKHVWKNGTLKKEIHINHIFYKGQRNFDFNLTSEIRLKLFRILKRAQTFKYGQMHFVNDGFDRKPSLGLQRQMT